MCKEEANSSKKREEGKMRIFHGEGEDLGCKEKGGMGALESGQGCPMARGKGSLKPMLGDGESVCEELYPSSFHGSFEELHSQRVTLTHFHLQRPLFILKG